jgi:predicted RNA-binding protein YlxR (DUF448 family)
MTTKPQRKKQRPPRHVPERTCIGCRKVREKRELIRIVHTESGGIEIDPTGKQSGRGAYLCRVKTCWEAGLKKEHLDRALRAKLTVDDRRRLTQYGDMFPG